MCLGEITDFDLGFGAALRGEARFAPADSISYEAWYQGYTAGRVWLGERQGQTLH